MAQLENIEAIEKRLWGSADTLRANSNYASNEYFMPVMGLIFLRHAYSRYLKVKPEIEPDLPSRGGITRPLTKEDFSRKGAIFLRPEAQFDYLVELTDADDRTQAIINAMESIEEDYQTLAGALPKTEYQELDNEVLGTLFRTFNDPALKTATGDIFGRIYEYFLTGFADQKAHDAGANAGQCNRARPRRCDRPRLRLWWHVCAKRPFYRRDAQEPAGCCDLLWGREKPDNYSPCKNEPCGPRP